MTHDERYIIVSEQILSEAETIMFNDYKDPYNSFSDVLDKVKAYKEAGLTPVVIFDKVEGTLECMPLEDYSLN